MRARPNRFTPNKPQPWGGAGKALIFYEIIGGGGGVESNSTNPPNSLIYLVLSLISARYAVISMFQYIQTVQPFQGK